MGANLSVQVTVWAEPLWQNTVKLKIFHFYEQVCAMGTGQAKKLKLCAIILKKDRI